MQLIIKLQNWIISFMEIAKITSNCELLFWHSLACGDNNYAMRVNRLRNRSIFHMVFEILTSRIWVGQWFTASLVVRISEKDFWGP